MEWLEALAPELSKLLADDAECQRLARRASLLAVEASGLDVEQVSDAVAGVEEGRQDVSAASEAQALTQRLDEAAWSAQETGREADYSSLFSQARAAAALSLALRGAHADAIYEAAYAFEEPEELVRRLREDDSTP